MKSELENCLIRLGNDFLNIPYKLLVFIPNGKVNYEYPVIYPVNADRISKSKKDRIRMNTAYRNFWDKDKYKFDTAIISNTGFTLEIPDDVYYSSYYSRGHLVTNVLVHHPELKKYGKLLTPIPVREILKVAKEQAIIDGRFTGTYCIKTDNYFSGYGGVNFVLEDKSKRVEDGKAFSRERYTKQFTTLWKPGYIYLLENNTSVLYLGDLSDSKKFEYEWMTSCGGKELLNSRYKNTQLELIHSNTQVPIFINLNSQYNTEFVQNTKETTISGFLIQYLSSWKRDYNPMQGPRGLEKFNTRRKRGIEISQFLKNDVCSVSRVISEFCASCVSDIGFKNIDTQIADFQYSILLGILPEDITPEISDTIITNFSYRVAEEIISINSRYGRKINVNGENLAKEIEDRMPHLINSLYVILHSRDVKYLKLVESKVKDIWKIEKP